MKYFLIQNRFFSGAHFRSFVKITPMNFWLILIPFISAFIGWFTNWIAIKMLFHPKEPKKILGIAKTPNGKLIIIEDSCAFTIMGRYPLGELKKQR